MVNGIYCSTIYLPVPKPSLLRHGDGGISNVATDFPGVALEPAPSRHIFLARGVATASSPGIFESRTCPVGYKLSKIQKRASLMFVLMLFSTLATKT